MALSRRDFLRGAGLGAAAAATLRVEEALAQLGIEGFNQNVGKTDPFGWDVGKTEDWAKKSMEGRCSGDGVEPRGPSACSACAMAVVLNRLKYGGQKVVDPGYVIDKEYWQGFKLGCSGAGGKIIRAGFEAIGIPTWDLRGGLGKYKLEDYGAMMAAVQGKVNVKTSEGMVEWLFDHWVVVDQVTDQGTTIRAVDSWLAKGGMREYNLIGAKDKEWPQYRFWLAGLVGIGKPAATVSRQWARGR